MRSFAYFWIAYGPKQRNEQLRLFSLKANIVFMSRVCQGSGKVAHFWRRLPTVVVIFLKSEAKVYLPWLTVATVDASVGSGA